jgi:hypothetical protein
MPDHAKCSVCGRDPVRILFDTGLVRIYCYTELCCSGPALNNEDAAWDAWDSLHGPRIPGTVKEVVKCARDWQLEAEFPTDSRVVLALDAAINTLTSETILDCLNLGIEQEPNR